MFSACHLDQVCHCLNQVLKNLIKDFGCCFIGPAVIQLVASSPDFVINRDVITFEQRVWAWVQQVEEVVPVARL